VILTGLEIKRFVTVGAIHITPFDEAALNPNSYDFRLGDEIVGYHDEVLDVRRENKTWRCSMNASGKVLEPGRIYLGHTAEVMGSDQFVPIIHAKSSIARLGLFIHVTADLIDIGSINQWTLQLYPVQPIRVYPGMLIGQVTFWTVQGEIQLYRGKYQQSRGAQASRIHQDFMMEADSK
jgi:dCTP deaminase